MAVTLRGRTLSRSFLRGDGGANEDLGVEDLGVDDMGVRRTDTRTVFTSCFLDDHGTLELINQSLMIAAGKQGGITGQTVNGSQRTELWP
jgi:hypothetical protein